MGSMFSFLRRRAAEETAAEPVDVPAEAAARAAEFWQRWDDLLPELASALGDSEPQRVENLVADMVASVHPNLTFAIEHGEKAVYALVLSGQADPELRPYTDAWIAAAPPQDTLWEYHDSVPPVPDPTGVTVNLRGEKYPLGEVRVAAQVDEAEGVVDVAVYHPGFQALEDKARQALTFLPLDATLGERLAADRLGRVETAEQEPEGAIGLLELRELVRDLDRTTTPES
ncbi:hypothetical protein SAMN02982929_02656 [Saccharopolyspora kobensis]|uniref:Uncharacterized protein n=2 Tax=Saccharopolyspora kobensis TaxID=146035 RepID=A0A1H6BK93_9PSEU|nr:hypothetical protein SAMN02982929_02656 [Saccharopolyspora kobensis]SFE87320.1 hypothetical protein SAMN05216506_115109 [Saccharopolyspora kobensis]